MTGSFTAAGIAGTSVDGDGVVYVATREDEHIPLGRLSEDGEIIVFTKFEAAGDWDGTVKCSEIYRIEWKENHAEVHAESDTFVCFKADDPRAESVASSPPFDPATVKGALHIEHVMKLPEIWAYPVGNMICRNILSGRGYANPSLIYGEYPDFESLGKHIKERLKDEGEYLKAHSESKGKLPMSLMVPVDDDALSIFEVSFRNRVSERTGKIVSKDTALKFIKACLACRLRNPFLERIPAWDGQKRVRTFAHDVGLTLRGRSDVEVRFYIASQFNTFLYQMARRAISGDDKGRVVSLCPIIIGEQGVGKSSLCQCLALMDPSNPVDGGFYSSTTTAFTDIKVFFESIGNNCVGLELDEGESIRKSSTGDVKSFINKTSDFYRDSYTPTARDHVRFFSPIVTTNGGADLLKDETGNRRFVPIWMIPSDDTRFHMDRDEFPSIEYMEQVWAELAWCVQNGVRTDLSEKEGVEWGFPYAWVDGEDGSQKLIFPLKAESDFKAPSSSYGLADEICESITDRDTFAIWLKNWLDEKYAAVGDFVPIDEMLNAYVSEHGSCDYRVFGKLVAKHIGLNWTRPGASGKKWTGGKAVAGYVRVKAPNGDTSLDAFEAMSG